MVATAAPKLVPCPKPLMTSHWMGIKSTHYHNLSCMTWGQNLHLLQPHLIPARPHSISSHSDLWQFPKLPNYSHIHGLVLIYFFIKYLFSGSTLDIGDKAVNRRLSSVIRIFSFWWRETDSKQINTHAARSWLMPRRKSVRGLFRWCDTRGLRLYNIWTDTWTN